MAASGRTALSEWSQIAAFVVAIWAMVDPPKRWPWLFSMLEIPSMALWIVAIVLFSFAILNGLVRLRHLETALASQGTKQESTLRQTMSGIDALIKQIQTPAIPLADNELPHLGVVWVWDDNRRVVVGPVCPKHRTVPLGYKPSHGDPVWENFEDKFISGSGRFICPADRELFPDSMYEGLEKVEHARTGLDDRFRVMNHLEPKPKRPPTPEELEMQREAQANLHKWLERRKQTEDHG